LPVYKPAATRKQIEKALDMLMAADKPLIVAGGGIINADASELLVEFAELTGVPVIPTLMGWGTIPDDHPLMAGMVGLQTSHRYGNATMLASDFVLGIGNRWANRHTGSTEVYCKGRTLRARGHRADADRPRLQPGPGHRQRREGGARTLRAGGARAQGRRAAEGLRHWAGRCAERKKLMHRKTHYTETPIKPMRVYEEMNKPSSRATPSTSRPSA
jgi:tartronate-semialdehyde synthase